MVIAVCDDEHISSWFNSKNDAEGGKVNILLNLTVIQMEYWDSEILNSNHWTVAGASDDMHTKYRYPSWKIVYLLCVKI